MANMNSVRSETKELLRFHSGCHGHPSYHSNEARGLCLPSHGGSIANVNLIRLKAKELQSELYFPIILIIWLRLRIIDLLDS